VSQTRLPRYCLITAFAINKATSRRITACGAALSGHVGLIQTARRADARVLSEGVGMMLRLR